MTCLACKCSPWRSRPSHSQVEFKPSIAELTQTVNTVSRDAIATTSAMPRLVDALRDDPDAESKHPSFYANISNDEDVLRVLVQVRTLEDPS